MPLYKVVFVYYVESTSKGNAAIDAKDEPVWSVTATEVSERPDEKNNNQNNEKDGDQIHA